MDSYIEILAAGGPPIRFVLEEGRRVAVGRGSDADLRVDGEPYLSRKHVELRLEGGRLRVERLGSAPNPVYLAGEQRDSFSLESGESFVVGSTRFRFFADRPPEAPLPTDAEPTAEHVMEPAEVYAASDSMRLKDLLELPEILRSRERGDFHSHIAGILRLATAAQWAAVGSREKDGTRILGRDAARDDAAPRLSGRLVARAVEAMPRPIFHSWRRPADGLEATVCEGMDWAVCAAADIPGAPPMVFYVAGSGGQSSPSARANLDNMRYVGLVADMVGRSLAVQRLEEWETRLERFFARRIVDRLLSDKDLKELEPKIAESTVLFFDIRGFSKMVEGSDHEALAFQRRLRGVMTAMTDEILREEGVVLQYMGDGILACWNVPCPDPDHVDRACRAAVGMVRRLARVDPAMTCGIGLHTGRVVAGTIGSEQLFAYGIVGAVINQASRIEGITKVVGSPILATGAVAERLTQRSGVAALRVGAFRPAGMGTPLDLYELGPAPADAVRAEVFRGALEALERGDWDAAKRALRDRPTGDGPARYLEGLAGEYAAHPPRDWRGVIELSRK